MPKKLVFRLIVYLNRLIKGREFQTDGLSSDPSLLSHNAMLMAIQNAGDVSWRDVTSLVPQGAGHERYEIYHILKPPSIRREYTGPEAEPPREGLPVMDLPIQPIFQVVVLMCCLS